MEGENKKTTVYRSGEKRRPESENQSYDNDGILPFNKEIQGDVILDTDSDAKTKQIFKRRKYAK